MKSTAADSQTDRQINKKRTRVTEESLVETTTIYKSLGKLKRRFCMEKITRMTNILSEKKKNEPVS
jgi:hypothetical protein